MIEIIILMAVAVIIDFRSSRIPNWIIVSCFFYTMGECLVTHNMEKGIIILINVTIVFICLYPLFRIGVIGAGDVKLLMVAGTIFDTKRAMMCMALAFIIGAMFSLVKMCLYGNYLTRMQFLAEYISNVIATGKIERYQHATEQGGWIRFSLPIVMAATVMIWRS